MNSINSTNPILPVPPDIHFRFRRVGRALMRVNANNSHSGNLSMRDPLNPDRFYVTASGSQCGELTPRCIVPLRFSTPEWEGVKPSTEAGIHRRILSLPGVNACVHCHSVAATAMSFDPPEAPVLGRRHRPNGFVFQPVDRWGALRLGPVPVGIYREAVGSAEMEARVPSELATAPAAVVAGHGPFARGTSLEECLRHLSLLETSVTAAAALRRRGFDLAALQDRLLADGAAAVFGPAAVDPVATAPVGVPGIAAEMRYWAAYQFDMGLGAFGTGSMSVRVSDAEMVYRGVSSAPEGVDVPLVLLPIASAAAGGGEPALHAAVYAGTGFGACIVAAAPLAGAEGTAVLNDVRTGGRPAAGIVPIDVEGRYLYGRLGLAGADALEANGSRVAGLLEAHRGCCVIAGCGVVAAARSLADAEHHVSSAERIARLRLEVELNRRLFGGPGLAHWEG